MVQHLVHSVFHQRVAAAVEHSAKEMAPPAVRVVAVGLRGLVVPALPGKAMQAGTVDRPFLPTEAAVVGEPVQRGQLVLELGHPAMAAPDCLQALQEQQLLMPVAVAVAAILLKPLAPAVRVVAELDQTAPEPPEAMELQTPVAVAVAGLGPAQQQAAVAAVVRVS